MISRDGVELHYDDRGEGHPVLLLHGGTTSGEYDWGTLDPYLSRYRRVRPDLRGHGRSGMSDEGIPLARLADDIEDLLDHLDLVRATVVGFSHAALAAVRFAVHRPERLDALVLMGFSPRVDANLREAMVTAARTWPSSVAQLHADRYDRQHWRRLLGWLQDERLRNGDVPEDALRALRVPTLLVVGDSDPYVSLEAVVHTARVMSDAQLLVVPGARHPVQRQAPEVVGAALARFLDQTLSSASSKDVA